MKTLENYLTKKEKQNIRKWYAQGKTIPDIAKKLGVSERKVIRNIPIKLLIKDI